MGIVNKQYTFQDKDDADPTQVNTNFDDLYNEFNGSIDDENIDFTKATLIETISDEIKNNLYDKIENKVFETIYPVGSIYTNANDPTNPIDLLGFGDWEKFGQGRVPVGHDSDDSDFDTGEKTGGEKTHTLTESEMPSHNHTTNNAGDHDHSGGTLSTTSDGAHSHSDGTLSTTSDGTHSHGDGSLSTDTDGYHDHNIDANGNHNHTGNTSTDGKHNHTYSSMSSYGGGLGGNDGNPTNGTRTTSTNGSHSHSFTTSTDGSHAHNADPAGNHSHDVKGSTADAGHHNHGVSGSTASVSDHSHTITGTSTTNGSHKHSVNNTGGDNAHNNLQPYITVYMWKRVA